VISQPVSPLCIALLTVILPLWGFNAHEYLDHEAWNHGCRFLLLILVYNETLDTSLAVIYLPTFLTRWNLHKFLKGLHLTVFACFFSLLMHANI